MRGVAELFAPPEIGRVTSVASQEAGEIRSHDLFSPSASNFDMDESCLNSQNTDIGNAGGEADAPRWCARAITLGARGSENSR